MDAASITARPTCDPQAHDWCDRRELAPQATCTGRGLRTLAVRAQWGPATGADWLHPDTDPGLAQGAAASLPGPAGAGPGARRAIAAVIAAIVAGAVFLAVWPVRAWRRERRIACGVAALRALDDRMLRDIGIERAAIGRVARTGSPRG
jgi:uncharacterized protein YjiS (DUF1127 family)